MQIRDAIVAVRLQPGAPLDEKALSAWLGVGLTPIRDALAKVRQAIGRPNFKPESSAVTVRIATSDDLELTLISKVLKRCARRRLA